MKPTFSFIPNARTLGSVLFASALFAEAAQAGSSRTHERAWFGGEYKLARRSNFSASSDSDLVRAFPEALAGSQRAGLLLVALATNTPAAAAGLREGDLVVQANGRPTPSLREFHRLIDGHEPGAAFAVTAYRDGDMREFTVTLGRESYRRERTLGLGLMLSSRIDLLPNPDFSLVAAGFKRRAQRVELESPESKFVLHTRSEAGDAPRVPAREGWRVWLAIVNVGSHKRVLTQEIVSGPVPHRVALCQ
jgi:membrane-associated protease RseP (regulator of RpoE activity)